MIQLENLSKAYATAQGMHVVLDDLSVTFPSRVSIGVVGRNGAGKSTLLRILGGAEHADKGSVTRTGRVSWPIGFAGGFSPSLTGEENCRFVARIYDADVDEVTEFARGFADIGAYFSEPVRTYSSGMRARLAFGLSMAIDFDTYLVDEVTAVGDSAFQERCRAAFAARRERSAVIIVSHNLGTIKQYCDRFALLRRGKLLIFDDLDEIERIYKAAA